jgi:hypothetical protein
MIGDFNYGFFFYNEQGLREIVLDTTVNLVARRILQDLEVR